MPTLTAVSLVLTTLGCRDTLDPWPGRPLGGTPARVVAQDTLLPSRDSYLNRNAPDANYGGNDLLTLGGSGRGRVVVGFDQAALAQAVGSGTLDSVWLELEVAAEPDGFGTGGRTVDLYRLTADWTEAGVTWNCGTDTNLGNSVPDCTPWEMGSATPPYASLRTARVTLTNGQTGVVRFNVTADVAAFLSGTANHGWLLRKTDETVTGQASVSSRESGSEPRLVVSIVSAAIPPLPQSTTWPTTDALLVASPSDTTYKYYRDVLGVRFAPGSTASDFDRIITKYAGTLIGGIGHGTSVQYYVIRFPDPGPAFAALDSLTAAIQAEPRVAHVVHLDYQSAFRLRGRYPIDSAMAARRSDWMGAGTARTWPWVSVRAPLGWGCETGEYANYRPKIAVADYSFDAIPVDLGVPAANVFTPPTAVRTPQQSQDPGHGVAVASIVAARGDNGVQMAGMVWRADLDLYAYATNGEGYTSPLDFIANIVNNAVARGVRVINISFGFGQVRDPTQRTALKSYLQYYIDSGPDRLLVIATGDSFRQGTMNALATTTDTTLSALDRVAAELILDSQYRGKVLFVTGYNQTGTSVPSANVWTGSDSAIIAAPSVDIYSLDQTSTLVRWSHTSFAAPFVTGVAAQLWSIDSTLTANEVTGYIIAGARQPRFDPVTGTTTTPTDIGYPGVYRLDAYGSLSLLSNQRGGTPLCGNRVWAEGNHIYAERAGGPELLLSLPDTAGFLNPYHGGRRIDFFLNGVGDVALAFANGSWSLVTDPFSIPAGPPSATWNSLNGMPHDGDSVATTTDAVTAGGRTVTLRYGTVFNSGRIVGTQFVPLLAADSICGTYHANHDSTGTFLGYGCVDSIPGTNYETASYRTTVPPQGGQILLEVNRFLNQAGQPSGLSPCPGTGTDAAGNPDCTTQTVPYSVGSQRAEVYEFPMQGGGGSGTLRWTRSGQTVHWYGISEAGSQGVMASSVISNGVTTGCAIEYVDPATGSPVRTAIPNPVACNARGTGGVASLRAAAMR